MAKLFFSYSHDDETYRDQLEKHLALLKHQGLIESWHDRRIGAGMVLDDVIDEKLELADIILLLISSSFMDSDYCYSREMQRAMVRHAEGSARVIPVIVRLCDWHSAAFGKLMAAPKDGKAITTWPNLDEAYTDVAQQIRKVVEALRRDTPTGSMNLVASETTNTTPAGKVLPRSSNLRLRKEFTDFDKDNFLHEAFEFIARFFEGSLNELEARNPGIKTRYQRVDDNTFTSTIYKKGQKQNECAIHLGSGGFRSANIFFSYDAAARGSSWHESISVECDDQSLYLKAVGMAMRQANHAQLSAEGAAEELWTLFIGQLQ
jgi:hypothetical protein